METFRTSIDMYQNYLSDQLSRKKPWPFVMHMNLFAAIVVARIFQFGSQINKRFCYLNYALYNFNIIFEVECGFRSVAFTRLHLNINLRSLGDWPHFMDLTAVFITFYYLINLCFFYLNKVFGVVSCKWIANCEYAPRKIQKFSNSHKFKQKVQIGTK